MIHPIPIISWLLDQVGLHGLASAYPHVVYSIFIFLGLVIVSKLAVGTVKLIPSGGQNFFEAVIGGLEDFMVDMMGEHGRPYFPLIATLFIYILCMNWIGLIPGMFSPTAKIETPLSMALVVFVVVQVIGIKEHGLKYVKHFTGPFWWLAPLMFPIEVIGHCARVVSLTLRLFGNVMGEDLVLAILFTLAGAFFAPTPMVFLFLFTSFVQAFVFTLLTMLYIAGSLEEAH